MNTPSINHAAGETDVRTRPSWQLRTLAIAAAVVVNVIILTIGRLINGEFPVGTAGNDNQTIGFAPVIVVTVVVGLVAWGLLVLLTRMTSRPRAIWTGIAIVIFVLSLFGPLGSDTNTSSKVVLLCLHVGAAATIVPLMMTSRK